MFGYNIWHTLFLSTEVFWPWPREPNCPSKFSTAWMTSTSRVVTPRATWHLRPSHAVSTPFWLSVNCYCVALHHKSLSLLSLLSVYTLFLPKIISRCICRMHGYICTSLRSRRPKDFGNQTRTVRKVRGRARSCVSTLLLRPIWLVRLPRKLQQVWFLTL